MIKNSLIELTVENFGFDGEGVAKHGFKPVFIKNALPDERILARIIYVNKNFARAIIEKIIIPSPYRIKPVCELFNKCGGCNLQHLKYSEQLKFKKKSVENTFHKIAGIDIEAEEVYPSPRIFNYRNKISMPVRQVNDSVKMGFYRQNSHDLIEVADCKAENELNRQIRAAVLAAINKEKMTGYDEGSGSGQIRHVVARILENKPYITIVVNEKITDKAKQTLDAEFNSLFSDYAFYLNYNSVNNNVIFGERFEFVRGTEGFAVIEGLKIFVHPNSFFQVNDGVRQALYKDVIASAGTGGVLIDAYSGAGLMTAMLAKNFDRAIGIEIVREANFAAEQLKAVNNISNMENLLGDCAEILPKLNINAAVTVLDPPRAGCHQDVLLAAANFCKKIIYISCNAATLARDVKLLIAEGFKIIKLKPYDMFPQTADAEVLAVLVKE